MSEKEKLLEIQDLVKDYGNGPVLDKVSLDVYKGDVIVLIGPSGCGKSTLLRCINGLEEIQSGKILLDGNEITGKKAKPNVYANGARHKCAICGRTELDDPTLTFRYCSKCSGNKEYCQEHLFTHEHK